MGTYLFRSPRSGLAGLIQALAVAGDRESGFPDAVWTRRHRMALAILFAHVIAIFSLSIVFDYGVEHGALEALVPLFAALMAIAATRGRAEAAGWVSVGLLSSFIVLLHLTHGALWMNLHFVAIILVLGSYRSWTTLVSGLATVAVQHVILGVTDPHSVYGDEASMAPLIALGQFAVLLVLPLRVWLRRRAARGAPTNAQPTA